MGSSLRCSEIESGGAAGGLVPLPIVPRRIKTSGRYVMWRWQGSGRDTFAIAKVLELTSADEPRVGTLLCTGKRQITMSWQSYVDDHLIGTGHVVQGAICGVDGAIWAVSAGFNVRPRASRGPVPSLFFSR